MTESERVTWWFRDFDEGGENQSCCILPSNRIYGGVASQFHFYPCDYMCPLFLPLLHLIWNVIPNMLWDLFHRAFKVMCSDHFKCMWYWMYMGNSIQWWMNLKEWPDDLEISSNGVITKVVALCLLIASMVVLLPNSTSIHVITCVLYFRCCNASYVR